MSARRLSVRKQVPLHVGWLTKQGGRVRSWKPRWFVIRGDHMYYYQKEDEIKLLGDVPLPGNEVSELPSNPDDPGKFYFQISPGKNRNYVNTNRTSYLFYAKSESERQEWISVIHRVLYAHIGGGVFGQSIEISMNFERRTSQRLVPRVVEECIQYLRDHGLRTEGVFRLPGAAGTVRRLKWAFNSATPVSFDNDGADTHSVASLLKLYLRELPEPVIPFKYYEEFTTMGLKIQYETKKAMGLLHEKLTQLPSDNYNLLKYLCDFLHDVVKNSEWNRMTDSNIAMMFGPNLLRTDDDNPMLMLSTADLNTLTVRALIANFEEVFQKDYYTNLHGNPDRPHLQSVQQCPLDYFEPLPYDSPCSSPMPSPLLSSRGVATETSPPVSTRSSNSSLNDDDHGHDRADDDDDDDHKPELRETVAFRNKSESTFSRDSRKRLRGFHILSHPVSSVIDVPTKSTDRVELTPVSSDIKSKNLQQTSNASNLREQNCEPSPDYDQDTASGAELLSQIKTLNAEVERLKKVQSNLWKIYQRQLDSQVDDVERCYKAKIQTLSDKLMDEKHATLLSVERLMSVQAELEKYQMKYGPLYADDDDLEEV